MEYKFMITEGSPKAVLSIRTRTSVADLPGKLGEAYLKIMGYLQEMDETPAGPPFAAYYNMDMEDLDVEMGIPVSGPLPGKEDISPGEIPGGKQATYLYKGPYIEMEPVYNAMMQWINDHGHVLSGVFYEFYFNSPLEVPESELLTKIVLPLKE